MAGGINKVILVGHLGRDPEVRTLESGVKVARFSLATTETYKDKSGERKDVTEWHNIVVWRNLADVAERYLTKGKLIYVEGKLRTHSWEDNGAKRYATEVVADNFTMLGSKSDGGGGGYTPPPVVEEPAKTTDNMLPPFLTEEEDLPF
ncbi:MAG: single-stranded DNA-binding protein [Bacteroidales bacterium]|jgi:single-strand DNA-binding protein|nr:single-stranded DNA-binding protein [Bacteroidales bacterium]